MFAMTYEYAQKHKVNVSGILANLELSRSGYNSYKKCLDCPSTQSQRKEIIKRRILSIYYKSREIYGAPKICQELRKEGHKISVKTVGNYMREMRIKACYVKPYTVTTIDPDFDSNLRNLLREKYNPSSPNSVWCSDITYIPTKEGFCYLSSIMDLYSRRIIAWRLSDTLEARCVVECVEEAKKKRQSSEAIILHTDRGSQYVSDAYYRALGNIDPSYSRKASPWENACMESFHALIKREWLNRFKIKTHEDARKLVFEYIEAFYNTTRTHSHCNYLSPKQYEDKLEWIQKMVA